MSRKQDIHVVPRGGGWAVRREGAARDSSHHGRKSDAMEAARVMTGCCPEPLGTIVDADLPLPGDGAAE